MVGPPWGGNYMEAIFATNSQCSQICRRDHGLIKFKIVALEIDGKEIHYEKKYSVVQLGIKLFTKERERQTYKRERE